MFTPPTPGSSAPSTRSPLVRLVAAAFAVAALLTTLLAIATPANAAPGVASAAGVGGRSFYVDPRGGDDAGPGTQSRPWRSLTRVSRADLEPGDVVRLRAARTHVGSLVLERSGSQAAPIRVEKYGAGRWAWVTRGACVTLRGDRLVVSGIKAVRCAEAGFSIEGDHVTVTRSAASRNIRGVWVKEGSQRAVVSYNRLSDNDRMAPGTTGGDDDHGAQGVDVNGDHALITRNWITGHRAASADYGTDGAAVEVYMGIGTVISYNRSVGNWTFTEFGHSRTRGTRVLHNQVSSRGRGDSFLQTRGAGQHWGPVTGTIVDGNTVRLSGAKSYGFGCYGGCTPNILDLRRNTILAGWYVGWADGTFRSANNLFRGEIWFELGPGDREI